MNLDWKKALGFGALVWIIMFVVISILVGYKIIASGATSMTVGVLLTILSLVLVFVAARWFIAPKSYMEAIQYGLAFAIVGIILDLLISRMFVPDMFSSVTYWVSYVLMIFVPLLAVKKGYAQAEQTTAQAQ